MRARTLRETFVHIERGQSIMLQIMQVEVGNPNVVWSANEDGTLRQHDFGRVLHVHQEDLIPMNVAIFCLEQKDR